MGSTPFGLTATYAASVNRDLAESLAPLEPFLLVPLPLAAGGATVLVAVLAVLGLAARRGWLASVHAAAEVGPADLRGREG